MLQLKVCFGTNADAVLGDKMFKIVRVTTTIDKGVVEGPMICPILILCDARNSSHITQFHFCGCRAKATSA